MENNCSAALNELISAAKSGDEIAFEKLLNYGVNGAMVNDPLSACQFVADTYYNN